MTDKQWRINSRVPGTFEGLDGLGDADKVEILATEPGSFTHADWDIRLSICPMVMVHYRIALRQKKHTRYWKQVTCPYCLKLRG